MQYQLKDGREVTWHFKTDTLNGSKEIFWSNGILAERYNYSNGKKNGPYSIFHKNGFIGEVGTFRNNLHHGLIKMYFSTDSAVLRRESYVIATDNDEFLYYRRDFNRDGLVIKEQTTIKFQKDIDGAVILRYVGEEKYDSMKIVLGNFDYRGVDTNDKLLDTLKFKGNILMIPSDSHFLRDEFIRGRFYGFNNHEKGDTIFSTLYFGFFEEKLNDLPIVRMYPQKGKLNSFM